MKKYGIVKQAKIVNMAVAACIVFAGILKLILQHYENENDQILFGIVCLLIGAAKMVGYFSNDMYRLAFQFDFAIGIFAAVLGILIFIGPSSIVTVLPLILGAYILLDGVLKIQTGLDARRFGMSRWALILITAIVVCLAGIAPIVLSYTRLAPFVGTLIGIAFIIDGCENIWITAYTVRVRALKKGYSDDNE